MKSNQPIAILVGILFITTVLAAFLALRYKSGFHKHQELSARAMNAHNAKALVSAIGSEVYEYSKTHPAIEPIVKTYLTAPANAAKPATR